LAEKGDYKFIISDISMGINRLDGFETTRMIKKTKPKQKVFLCSALDPRIVEEEYTQSGADGFIPKPIDGQYLSEMINRHF
jgi:CheY-like chemotaxis protein